MSPATSSVRRAPGALVGLAALGLVAAACSTVDSGDLRTSGMQASIVVTARADSVDVTVGLDAGGLTSVKLQDEDRLFAVVPDAEEQLTRDSFLGKHVYGARLTGTYPPGSEVDVEFRRAAEDHSATSTVLLPPALRVTEPPEGTSTSRARDLRFAVNRAAGSVRVHWEGSCVVTGDLSFEEDEPVVVPAGTLQRPAPPASPSPEDQQQAPATCTVTWTVARVVTGSLSEEFDSGSIEARREVGLALTSKP